MPPSSLYAGAARVDITPRRPIPKGGFRLGPNAPHASLDPLLARALVLKAGGRTVALVAVDLLIVSAAMTDAVRKRALAEAGVPEDNLLLGASHTHSGPDLFPFMFEGATAEDVQWTVDRIAEAVRRAAADLHPARLGVGRGHLPQLGVNRRDPSLPMDPEVGVFRVDREDGEPVALVVNYAVHPIMVGPTNPFYSADLPGFAMAQLEHAYGEDRCVALFLQGAAGDINPTRFPFEGRRQIVPQEYSMAGARMGDYDRDIRPLLQGRDWDWGKPTDLRRAGRLLAGEVMRVSEQIVPVEEARLAARRRSVELPLRSRTERIAYVGFTHGTPALYDYWVNQDMVRTEVQTLRVGPAVIVALPGEPFVELGLELKALGTPKSPVFVVGYANDDIRYVLTPAAYDEGRYEVNACVLRPEATQMLMETARSLIDEVKVA
jgi:hypothetical protein